MGIPVVCLPQLISGLRPSYNDGRLLVILLSSGQYLLGGFHNRCLLHAHIVTFFALLAFFLPQIPTWVSPALFLIYTVFAALRVSLVFKDIYKLSTITERPITIQDAWKSKSRHQKGCSHGSTTSTITAINYTIPDIEYHPTSSLVAIDAYIVHPQAQVAHNRARSLLILLFAAQLCNIGAYSCAVATEIHPKPSSAARYRTEILQIIQTFCTVLSVLGIMSAYFRKSRYLHLVSSPFGFVFIVHRSRPSERHQEILGT